MNRVDAWFDHEAERAARRPTLPEALLTGRRWAYAAHRTRYLVARVPIRVALHLVEVIVLGALFPIDELGPIFAIRAAMTIVGSLHWGALEALRDEVRALAARRAWTRAAGEIRWWLLRSLGLGVAALAIALLWVRFGPVRFASFSIFDAYALAAGFRVLFETVTRVYTSGIGALRRLPRPFWSGLPGDVVDLLGAVLLMKVLGGWGFAVALFAGGLLRSALSLIYAHRGYSTSKLRGFGLWPRFRNRSRLAHPVLRAALAGAVGNATAQLDAWILLALTLAASTQEDALLVAAIHVLRPLLSASVGWTRLFYLDLKQIQFRGRLLQQRFERFLVRLALTLSVLAAIAILALSPLVFGESLSAPALWLIPFLAVRAVFATRQVQAFSYGRTRYLLWMAAAIGAGIAAVTLVPILRLHALPALTLWIGLVAGAAPPPRGTRRPMEVEVVGLYRWLSLISRATDPVRVVTARVPQHLSLSIGRVAAELARARGVAVSTLGARHLVWFETGGAEPGTDAERVVAGAGCLEELRSGPERPDGKTALRAALEAGLFERSLTSRLLRVKAVDADVLRAEFKQALPAGAVLDGKRGRLPTAPGTPRPGAVPLRQALGEVFRLADSPGGRAARNVPGHFAVYSPGGEPELVFVLPHDVDAEARVAWRQRVEDANLAASMT